MSSIVSFTLGIVEYFRDRKLEGWIFAVIASLFLIVACDQAWQDEHRNAQQLVAEKRTADSEKEFWKIQSYNKDAALSSRDDLLAKNFTVLGQTQTVLGQTQSSLASLSSKVLEITKPEHFHIYMTGEKLPYWDKPHKQEYMMLAFPNKVTAQVNVILRCNRSIESARAYIFGHNIVMGKGTEVADGIGYINITSPSWGPTQPLVIYVASSVLPDSCNLQPY